MPIRQRLRSLLWRVPLDQEVRDELAHHIELRTEELIAHGLDPAAAREEAEKRLGSGQVAAELRRLGADRNRSWARREWLDEFRQDLMFAIRQCRTRPGFAAAAVLTLALGLGATTAIFSVVHAVVLKPYAYADPDRVLLAFTTFQGNRASWSVGNFDYFRQRLTTVEHFAAAAATSLNLSDDGAPERIAGRRVTANFFPLFGIAPALGRTFTAGEDHPGGHRVVVLSNGLWQRRFGGDPGTVGRSIRLNGEPYDVIGIMPPAFDQIGDTSEAWIPVAFTPAQLTMYDESYLEAYVRQQPGATLAQVEGEFARVAAALAKDHPEINRDRGASVTHLSTFLIGDYRLRLMVLLAAVTLVLLIACGNVANLLLARLAARSRELAIRAAIGAGRGRIVRQVLTESLVLSALGGAAGLLLAWWIVPILIALAPEGVPRLATARLDGAVIATAAGLIAASALLVGLLPAWLATRRTALADSLGDGKGALTSSLKPWMRQSLIAAQAALVMVVLSGAALLIRSSINLQQEPIGLDTTGVLTARVALPGSQYGSAARTRQAFDQILERLQAAPGVRHAALDSQAPFVSRGGSNGLIPEGRPVESDRIQAESHFVTPGYFDTLGIPLRSGRVFTAADVRQAPLVMIINETLARTAFGDAAPLGKLMICCEGSPSDPMWKTVVGVVADIKARGPAQPARPEFYLPIAQTPDVALTMWIGRTFGVMARGNDTAALSSAIREAVRSVDSSVPVFALRTMDEGVGRTMAQARFNTLMMTVLATSGLVLAALGIYSVIAWLVAQRTREIGVRMALGASSRDVVMMSAHGLKPVAAGLVTGFAGAMASAQLLEGQLFEVGPRDPLALIATASLLLVVAGAAATIPAWRATTIDPSAALRD